MMSRNTEQTAIAYMKHMKIVFSWIERVDKLAYRLSLITNAYSHHWSGDEAFHSVRTRVYLTFVLFRHPSIK